MYSCIYVLVFYGAAQSCAVFYGTLFFNHSTVLHQNVFQSVVASHRMLEREREEITPPTDPER